MLYWYVGKARYRLPCPRSFRCRPAEGTNVSNESQPEFSGALEAGPRAAAPSHPALRYSLYRIGLFVGVFAVSWGIFYVFGVGSTAAVIALAGMSVIVSGVLSYFLLDRQRDAMSAALVARVERAKARIEETASAEDNLVADITPGRRPSPDPS